MDESEHIEIAALMDLHDAAPPDLKHLLALESITKASAQISIAGTLPESAIVINRTLGIGPAVTPQMIQDVVGAYRDRGVRRYFVQVDRRRTPNQIARWLLSTGLEKARGWQKFRRGRDAIELAETELKVQEIGAEYGLEFAQIVCNAFDLGIQAEPWLAELPGRQNWHIFMSFEGDQPVGTGALFMQDGIGWTDWGATAPEFRKRGSQRSLLAIRIERALELGCASIFTCTGEDVPGDPQHSYSNIMRAGFEEHYLRENYAPPRN